MTGWEPEVEAAAAVHAAGNADGAVAAARRCVVAADGPEQETIAYRLLGDALVLRGHREAARTALDRALKAAEGLPRGHLVRGSVHNSMGILEKFWGDFDAAATHYQAALDSQLGQQPLARAALLHNLGGLAHSRRDLAAAEVHTRAALELHDEVCGRASAQACADRGQLASIVSGLGRHEEAVALLAEAIAGFEALFGADHLEVGIAMCTLGAVHDRAGRLDEAEAAYRRGLAIRESAYRPTHPELAPTLLNLGRLLDRRGDRAAGRRLAQRAVDNLAGQVVDDSRFIVAARRRLTGDA